MSNEVPDNARFVCFGCMSNVGTLTGAAYGDPEMQVAGQAILDAVR